MSFSIQRAVSDGSMVLLPVSIEYFDRSEISVLFDGVMNARQWAWVGSTEKSISFTPAVANGIEVSVKRLTDISTPRHQFSHGAQFTTESLDEDIRQVLHIAQEAKEGSGLGEVYQDLNFHGFRATNMGNGSLPGDAVNHAQMQVHDATIVGYKDAAQASAVAAANSAASISTMSALFPTPTAPNSIPMSNPAGNGWFYNTIAQLKTLLGLGSAAYTDSTAYQAADADIPTVAASQVEMEAGTESALRSMSPLRVAQAIDARSTPSTPPRTYKSFTAASGTLIYITSIPTTATKITIIFESISTNGSQNLLVQIGDSEGIENIGYVSTAMTGTVSSNSTSGFICTYSNSAPNASTGILELHRLSPSSRSWIMSGQLLTQSSTVTSLGGIKTLSAVLDRLAIYAGGDTFDGGGVNVVYE